jgi:hypothetical protein
VQSWVSCCLWNYSWVHFPCQLYLCHHLLQGSYEVVIDRFTHENEKTLKLLQSFVKTLELSSLKL